MHSLHWHVDSPSKPVRVRKVSMPRRLESYLSSVCKDTNFLMGFSRQPNIFMSSHVFDASKEQIKFPSSSCTYVHRHMPHHPPAEPIHAVLPTMGLRTSTLSSMYKSSWTWSHLLWNRNMSSNTRMLNNKTSHLHFHVSEKYTSQNNGT